MRFLGNENVASATVDALRARGGDVVWVKEQMRGASDAEILERGRRDERVLLTFDKDFGELAFRAGLRATCGIVCSDSGCRKALPTRRRLQIEWRRETTGKAASP